MKNTTGVDLTRRGLEAYRFGRRGEFEIRPAASLEERLRIWRFVYRAYLRKGYVEPNPRRLWYSAFDAAPGTVAFVVEEDRSLAATISLAFDGPMGLPSDDLYEPEVDRLRQAGRRVCEPMSMVNVGANPSIRRNIIMHLFRLLYFKARGIEGRTDLLITVNPRHVAYYTRYLLFSVLGGERAFPKMSGAPAVLLRLKLDEAEDMFLRRFGHLGGERNLHRFFFADGPAICEWLRRSGRALPAEDVRSCFLGDAAPPAPMRPAQREYLEWYYGPADGTRTEGGGRC